MWSCWAWWAPRAPQRRAVFDDADRAILELKVVRDKQNQYARHCAEQAQRAEQLARRFLDKGARKRAAQALRCKKTREEASRTASAYVLRLEELIAGVEDAVTLRAVVAALQLGNESLAQLNQQLVDADPDATMETVREQLAQLDEPLFANDTVDDESLLDEDLRDLAWHVAGVSAEQRLLRELPPLLTAELPPVPLGQRQRRQEELVEAL